MALTLGPGCSPSRPAAVVGSKKFTESVILGELLQLLGSREWGVEVSHRRELGGTRILWNSLVNGELDFYPEYTGTITQEILADQDIQDESTLEAQLARQGIRITRPLGFNNTYVLGMKKESAAAHGIETISDLRKHPGLKFGFTNEFMDRGDGWPSLRKRYRLPQKDVRGLDHDIAYRGLASGSIHVMDLYSTDAEIQYYDLKVLQDDLRHFPDYYAVILYRADLEERLPGASVTLASLEGQISAVEMIAMNARAKLDKVPEARVAADFLAERLGQEIAVEDTHAAQRIWRTTLQHLYLVGVSLLAAILVAVPLGIWAARSPRGSHGILGVVGIIQTIPALALLVLMMPLLEWPPLKRLGVDSLGEDPAILALFLYSLLPIVRNTFTGLREIPSPIRESAAALGLPSRAQLMLVELPMASRMILAGIKTAAVINIGFATLGAFIGAGGYGQPILTGIRLDDRSLILEGALPAALLALLVQGLFELAERLWVPKGLRLKGDD
ncbi:MAG: glycine betaine ABC transporter substrate-binding protein [Planctomycetota bacterium]